MNRWWMPSTVSAISWDWRPSRSVSRAAKPCFSFVRWEWITRRATVVVDGFKQALERGDGSPNGIMHGTHLVLIDKAGVIRGFYRSDEEGLLRIARDARRLIAGKE